MSDSPPQAPRVPDSRPALPAALVVVLSTAAAVGALAIVCRATGVPFSDLSRDVTEVLKAPFYLGAVSMLGILVWGSSAFICVFAATLGPRHPPLEEQRRFLLVSGFVTAWLVLDDLLTLHEIVIPIVLPVRQRYVIAMYAVAMVLYLVRFRGAILGSEPHLLGLALGCFALSVLSDAIQTRLQLPAHHYIEDGLKVGGILAWTVYFWRAAARHARSAAGAMRAET